jgi:hypothetical protein
MTLVHGILAIASFINHDQLVATRFSEPEQFRKTVDLISHPTIHVQSRKENGRVIPPGFASPYKT